jgi:hypothetical protein
MKLHHRLLVLAAIVCACGTVAGCGETSPGTPQGRVGNTEVSDSTDTSSEEPAVDRPREITLEDRDPCALVPQADWPKFHIEKPGKPKQNSTFKSPECFYANDTGGVAVTLVITEGIEVWTDGGRSAQIEKAPPVEGFPALSATIREDDFACDALVDVADGQYLKAYAVVTASKESELPERCEFAHQLAESAMRTLVGS